MSSKRRGDIPERSHRRGPRGPEEQEPADSQDVSLERSRLWRGGPGQWRKYVDASLETNTRKPETMDDPLRNLHGQDLYEYLKQAAEENRRSRESGESNRPAEKGAPASSQDRDGSGRDDIEESTTQGNTEDPKKATLEGAATYDHELPVSRDLEVSAAHDLEGPVPYDHDVPITYGREGAESRGFDGIPTQGLELGLGAPSPEAFAFQEGTAVAFPPVFSRAPEAAMPRPEEPPRPTPTSMAQTPAPVSTRAPRQRPFDDWEAPSEADEPDYTVPDQHAYSSTPDAVVYSPEPDAVVYSPEPDVVVYSPEPDDAAYSPEPDDVAYSPQPDDIVILRTDSPFVAPAVDGTKVEAAQSEEPDIDILMLEEQQIVGRIGDPEWRDLAQRVRPDRGTSSVEMRAHVEPDEGLETIGQSPVDAETEVRRQGEKPEGGPAGRWDPDESLPAWMEALGEAIDEEAIDAMVRESEKAASDLLAHDEAPGESQGLDEAFAAAPEPRTKADEKPAPSPPAGPSAHQAPDMDMDWDNDENYGGGADEDSILELPAERTDEWELDSILSGEYDTNSLVLDDSTFLPDGYEQDPDSFSADGSFAEPLLEEGDRNEEGAPVRSVPEAGEDGATHYLEAEAEEEDGSDDFEHEAEEEDASVYSAPPHEGDGTPEYFEAEAEEEDASEYFEAEAEEDDPSEYFEAEAEEDDAPDDSESPFAGDGAPVYSEPEDEEEGTADHFAPEDKEDNAPVYPELEPDADGVPVYSESESEIGGERAHAGSETGTDGELAHARPESGSGEELVQVEPESGTDGEPVYVEPEIDLEGGEIYSELEPDLDEEQAYSELEPDLDEEAVYPELEPHVAGEAADSRSESKATGFSPWEDDGRSKVVSGAESREPAGTDDAKGASGAPNVSAVSNFRHDVARMGELAEVLQEMEQGGTAPVVVESANNVRIVDAQYVQIQDEIQEIEGNEAEEDDTLSTALGELEGDTQAYSVAPEDWDHKPSNETVSVMEAGFPMPDMGIEPARPPSPPPPRSQPGNAPRREPYRPARSQGAVNVPLPPPIQEKAYRATEPRGVQDPSIVRPPPKRQPAGPPPPAPGAEEPWWLPPTLEATEPRSGYPQQEPPAPRIRRGVSPGTPSGKLPGVPEAAPGNKPAGRRPSPGKGAPANPWQRVQQTGYPSPGDWYPGPENGAPDWGPPQGRGGVPPRGYPAPRQPYGPPSAPRRGPQDWQQPYDPWAADDSQALFPSEMGEEEGPRDSYRKLFDWPDAPAALPPVEDLWSTNPSPWLGDSTVPGRGGQSEPLRARIDDRRIRPRLIGPAGVVYFRRQGRIATGDLGNLSLTGAMVRTRTPVPPGTTIPVALELPALSRPIRLMAQVVYVRRIRLPSGQEAAAMGVAFSQMEREDQRTLIEYLSRFGA